MHLKKFDTRKLHERKNQTEYISDVVHSGAEFFINKVRFDKPIFDVIFKAVLNQPHFDKIYDQIIEILALIIDGLEKASELEGY